MTHNHTNRSEDTTMTPNQPQEKAKPGQATVKDLTPKKDPTGGGQQFFGGVFIAARDFSSDGATSGGRWDDILIGGSTRDDVR